MNYTDKFPLGAGFLFPNGEYYSTYGGGHEKLAYRILKEKLGNNFELEPCGSETMLQEKYSAILIRYGWGQKFLYLPKVSPPTLEGKAFFRRAVSFYAQEGFQILNLYKISLEDIDFAIVKEFSSECFLYEDIEIKNYFSTQCSNYTNTIICNSIGNYIYNPERIGD